MRKKTKIIRKWGTAGTDNVNSWNKTENDWVEGQTPLTLRTKRFGKQ